MASFGNLSVAVNNTSTVPNHYGSVWDPVNERLAILYHTTEGTAGTYLLIAEKSAGVLVYGTPQLLVAGTLGSPQILFDSGNSRVVIAGHDNLNSRSACWVAAVNAGSNSATIGSAVEWLPTGNNANDVRVCYDSTNSKVIIFCKDSSDSNTMKTVVGTVSGTTISFGTPGTVAPSPGPLDDYALVYDPVAAKVILFFTDQSYTDTQYYIGTVSGTGISFGSKFLADSAQWYSLHADWNPNAQKVIVDYQPDYGSRVFRQGALSGSTFTWDDEVSASFSAGGKQADRVLYNATNDKFLLFMGQTGTVYQEVAVDGNTSVFSPASVVYENEYYRINPAASTDGNDFFVVEANDVTGVKDLEFGIADASVSAASPCRSVTLGLEQAAAVGYGDTSEFRRAAWIGGNRFVVLYRDDATNNWTVVAGQTDSAGDITFGTPVLVSGTDVWQTISLAKAGEGKACVFGENVTAALCTAHLITVTGLSISVGAANRPVASGIDNTGNSIDYDPASGKVVAVWAQSSVMYTCTGTASGTTISWGTPVNNGAISLNDAVLTNIGSGKFAYAYNSAGSKIRIADISGSGLAFGSEYAVDDIGSTSGTTGQVAVDPATGNIVVSFRCNDYPQNMDQRVRLASVSGTTITWLNVSSPLYHASINESRVAIAFDPYSGALISGFSTDDNIDRCRIQASAIQEDGYIQNCPAVNAVFREADGFAWSCHDVLTDDENEYAVVIAWEQSGAASLVAFTVRGDKVINYSCDIKPKTVVIDVPGLPGSPGFAGQAYVPAYCTPGYTIETTVQYVTTPSGTYEYRCVTGPTEESLVLGFPEQETICSFTPVVVPQSTDPYAPNYDPDYDPNSSPSSSFGGIGVQTTTPTYVPPKCYPAIPYIPPSPATAPTPTEYSVDYNLGWNYDSLIATGSNITVDIGIENVRNDTSGVAVGFSNLTSWGLNGIGKFPVFVLFEANRVSVIKQGVTVWGQVVRALTDVFSLRQFGAQVAVYKNDVEIYKADVLSGGAVAAGAIIYKAGDAFCLPLPGDDTIVSQTAGLSGSGSGSIALSALEVLAYEGSYGIGDVTLPVLIGSGSTGGHGGADIDLPALFGSGVEGFGGFALIDLPIPGATGYAADALSGYANITLPGISGVGADSGGYAFGATELPALAVSASGDFAIPASQGADVTIPALMFGAKGLTGSVGGSNISLPPLDSVGAENAIYGEMDKSLPALRVIGGEIPVYDGVLDGYLGRLEVVTMYGRELPISGFDGFFGFTLEGDLQGGAYLDQNISVLEAVSLTGTLDVVGRLDGYFLAMTMNSTGIAGMYGELTGVLGERLTGELYGGALFDGSMAALSGELSGTTGAVATLDGAFAALAGDFAGNLEAFGTLDGDLPTLESLWGVLSGDLPGLTGEYVQAALSVSEYVAWVVNLKNSAITRYPAWQFDFLVRFRDENYFVRSDGIYRVDTGFDIDQPIDAGFTLPENDMGVETMKISPRLYLQGDIDGQFSVQTTADSQTPVISLSQIAPGVGYKRCKLPRGIKGTHLEFAVDNVAGADFEIEQVDALVADTGRKI